MKGNRMNETRNKGKMSRLLSVLLAAATLSSCLFSVGISAEESPAGAALYVSPNGDDSAAGTVDAPLRTLEGARDAVRELRKSGDPDGGITVYFREGVYTQLESLALTAEDSGTETCPITYKAYDGEKVVISGGYTLDPTKYTVPSDEIKARLDKTAQEKVVAYDLKAAGVDWSDINTDPDGNPRIDSRLYYDGIRGWTGRYPNDSVVDYSYVVFGDTVSGTSFVDPTGRVAKWAESSVAEARLYGTFEIDYETTSGYVKSYNAKTDRVTISIDGGRGMNKNGRFFYYNVLEEVDSVGEYYIDDATGMLCFYAPDNYKDIDVSFALCRGSIIDADVSYYTFDGLDIECAVDSLISITGDNNTVSNCVVRDCSDNAINFVGSGTTIYNNEISYIGGGGVAGRMPNTVYMQHSDTLIDNNLIHDYAALRRTYNAAVGLGEVAPGRDGGYGVVVSHNEIYNGPHLALSYLCRDALFEYNYIHNVCYEAGDAGAVYDGTWLSNGMIFRNNVIRDINNPHNPFLNPNGYYCDDSGGGKQVYSNLFINIDGAGICTSGQDNDIHDNILINTATATKGDRSIYTDSRSYYKLPGDKTSVWTTSAIFNTAGLNGLWAWLMHPELNPAYGIEQWAYRYPWTMLLKTTNVYDREDRFVSYAFGDSKVRQNVLYPVTDSIFTTTQTRQLIYFRDNLNLERLDILGFGSEDGDDFIVPSDADIFALLPGFRPCDYANVGRVTVEGQN